MEKKGLIIREPVSYDKRAKRIILTEAALKICEDNKTKILATEKELAKDLSDEELKTFFYLLDKIKQNIEHVEARERKCRCSLSRIRRCPLRWFRPTCQSVPGQKSRPRSYHYQVPGA